MKEKTRQYCSSSLQLNNSLVQAPMLLERMRAALDAVSSGMPPTCPRPLPAESWALNRALTSFHSQDLVGHSHWYAKALCQLSEWLNKQYQG